MARYVDPSDDFVPPSTKTGIDLYKEKISTPEGLAAMDKYEKDLYNYTLKVEEASKAANSGGFLGVLDKILDPVMNTAIAATPWILAAGLGDAASGGALTNLLNGGSTAAGGSSAGSGSVFTPNLGNTGLPNVGDLVGGMPYLDASGSLAGAGAGTGGGLGSIIGGADSVAGGIPQVIVPGTAPASQVPAWIGAGTGIAVGDLIGGMPESPQATPEGDDHLPEGTPVPGTEGNDYPIWAPPLPGDITGGYGTTPPTGGTGGTPSLPGGGGGTGGSGGGINLPGLIGGISDYFNNNYDKKYYKDLIDKLNGMYNYGTPEEQFLRQKIEAQDAASGRRSQYGIREQNLAGILAQQRANIMTNPVYAGYVNAYTGKRDDSLNSLLGYLGSQTGTGTTGGTSGGGLGGLIGGIGNTIGTIGNGIKNVVNGGTNLANSLFGGS